MPPDLPTLNAALAKAQGAFPTIERSRTVTVQTKSGGSFTYSYAPLDAILAAVRPVLAENDLAIAQLLAGAENGAGAALVTQLRHASGELIESAFPFRPPDDPQALGSLLTYLRRYAITALLGIAADTDDDGAGAKGSPPQARGKIPPEHQPTQREWDAISEVMSELAALDPDTDWNERAREIAGVPGDLLTKTGAGILIRELRAQRDRLSETAATADATPEQRNEIWVLMNELGIPDESAAVRDYLVGVIGHGGENMTQGEADLVIDDLGRRLAQS